MKILGHGPQADLSVYAPGLEVVDVVVGARGGEVRRDVYVEAGVEQDGQDVFPLGQVVGDLVGKGQVTAQVHAELVAV